MRVGPVRPIPAGIFKICYIQTRVLIIFCISKKVWFLRNTETVNYKIHYDTVFNTKNCKLNTQNVYL